MQSLLLPLLSSLPFPTYSKLRRLLVNKLLAKYGCSDGDGDADDPSSPSDLAGVIQELIVEEVDKLFVDREQRGPVRHKDLAELEATVRTKTAVLTGRTPRLGAGRSASALFPDPDTGRPSSSACRRRGNGTGDTPRDGGTPRDATSMDNKHVVAALIKRAHNGDDGDGQRRRGTGSTPRPGSSRAPESAREGEVSNLRTHIVSLCPPLLAEPPLPCNGRP